MIIEVRLRRAVKAYMENFPAMKAWRDVGKSLGLTAEELEEIGGRELDRVSAKRELVDHQQVRENAQKMLARWMESAGDGATSDRLRRVAKRLKLNEVAGNIDVMQLTRAHCTHSMDNFVQI